MILAISDPPLPLLANVSNLLTILGVWAAGWEAVGIKTKANSTQLTLGLG